MAEKKRVIEQQDPAIAEQMAKMVEAGNEAAIELGNCKTAKDIQIWWHKWYLKAGHKRLARALLAHSF